MSVTDLQIILGPNTSFVSEREEVDDNSLDESYDVNNCYNIFTHNIRFKLDQKKSETLVVSKREEKNKKEETTNGYGMNIMKNLRITITGLHIRYEDDFFSTSPFACGILCDQITSHGSTTEWHFGSLESNKFTRINSK